MLDIGNIPFDDPNVWDMICEGRVKGCFQIEAHLGKTWCKKIKPRSIRELSDVIALIRPGALKGKIDGKTIANHYADRRDGKDEVKIIHPSIVETMSKTYGVFIYQETILKVAQIMAKFDMRETLKLQKGIGKKDSKVINELRDRFVSGSIANNISKEIAEDVFSAIQKSGRYLFNLSHSCEYAIEAYKSAYLKTYYPILYFKNWLRHADEKTKPDIEVKQLVSAAKSEEIGVKSPSVLHLKENFFLDGENIRFGICNVKNVGKAHLDRLISLKVNERKTWIETLFFVLPEVNKRAVEGLINVGAFSHLGVSRTQMKHEFACIEKVNDKEFDWIRAHFLPARSIHDHILMAARVKKEGGACHTVARVEKLIEVSKRLQNPGRSLSDSPVEYAKAEEDLLGVAICHSELSACADACHANAKCKDLAEGRSDTCTLAVVIKAVKVHMTKKKEEMAFLEVEDDSGELDNVVVFPNVYAIESPIIYEESTVLLTGRLNEKGGSKSFVVESVYQI